MALGSPADWRVKQIYMFTDFYLERRNVEIREKGADLIMTWPPLLQELFLTLKRAHGVLKEANQDLSLAEAIKVDKGALMDVVEDLWFCLYHVFAVSYLDPDTAKRLGAADIILNSCFELYFNDSTPLILFWAFLFSHLLRLIGRGDCVGKDQTEEDSRMQSEAIDLNFKALKDALDLGGVPKGLDLDELYELRPVGHDGVLGEGAQGKVYKRVLRDEEVAVKEVSRDSLQALVSSSSVAWGSKGVVSNLDREVRILDWLKHPNVVELKGVTRRVEGAGKYGLVMELMDKTLEDLISDENLHPRILKNTFKFEGALIKLRRLIKPPPLGDVRTIEIKPPPLGDVRTIDILLQVARGMRFLHSSNVVHRDLKTSNVLIGLPDPSVPGDALRVKLADFGLSAPYRAAASSSSEALGDQNPAYKLGTSFYMAPEVGRQVYTTKADVFSFGSICFRLTTGIPLDPDHLLPRVKFYKKIQQGRLSDLLSKCPKYLVPLLKMCWSTDPEKRPDFSYICKELLSLKRHALLGLDLVSAIGPSNWWCTRSRPYGHFVRYEQTLPQDFILKTFKNFEYGQLCSFWEGGDLTVGKDPYQEEVRLYIELNVSPYVRQ